MYKLNNDQRGVAHILIVILILLLGILSFAGWKIWTINKASSDTVADTTSSEKIATTKESTPSPESISSASDSYSVLLPDGWLHSTCEDSDILFIAPDEESLGRCNSEYFGALAISRSSGDTRTESDPSADPSAIDVSISTTTIDGQAAERVSYEIGGEEMIIPVGTKFIRYQVFHEGNTYVMATGQAPGGASYEAELDTLVGTFRFRE